ncbi:MAG: hypothetical protein IJB96_06520 [Lachnospira sp.]|nr:hypothetical protein [Lachnospira sp.]
MRVENSAIVAQMNRDNYINSQRDHMAQNSNQGEAFYEKLKTWTKGANGESKLVSLNEVPTGAVYLASNESRDRLIDTEKLEKNSASKLGQFVDVTL